MNETVWIVIQQLNLADYLAAPQYAAVTSGLLAPGQAGRFAGVMADVASNIQAAIRVNYTVSANPQAIPQQAKSCACYLIIEGLQSSITTLKLTDDQKLLIKKQEAWLEAVKAGTEVIDTPSWPATNAVQLPRGVQVATGNRRDYTKEKMRGL